MWHRVHGHDVEDPPTKKRVIGHSRILEPSLRAPEKAWLLARKLTVKAATRLRREEYFATVFDLCVSEPDGRWWQSAQKLPPGQDNFMFLKALETLWDSMVAEFNPPRLLSVAVGLHGLCKGSEITPDLFDTASEAYKKVQGRHNALTSAMDRINKRFGADTIQLGISPPTQAGYVGTKISYTRIPDLAEFNE
jgi:DNA polymerase-4